jgi:hypothetical protein
MGFNPELFGVEKEPTHVFCTHPVLIIIYPDIISLFGIILM